MRWMVRLVSVVVALDVLVKVLVIDGCGTVGGCDEETVEGRPAVMLCNGDDPEVLGGEVHLLEPGGRDAV